MATIPLTVNKHREAVISFTDESPTERCEDYNQNSGVEFGLGRRG